MVGLNTMDTKSRNLLDTFCLWFFKFFCCFTLDLEEERRCFIGKKHNHQFCHLANNNYKGSYNHAPQLYYPSLVHKRKTSLCDTLSDLTERTEEDLDVGSCCDSSEDNQDYLSSSSNYSYDGTDYLSKYSPRDNKNKHDWSWNVHDTFPAFLQPANTCWSNSNLGDTEH